MVKKARDGFPHWFRCSPCRGVMEMADFLKVLEVRSRQSSSPLHGNTGVMGGKRSGGNLLNLLIFLSSFCSVAGITSHVRPVL